MLGDLKECDGTHSECSARKVPTLKNQRKHRTKQGDLWEIFGLSVAVVLQIFVPLYIIFVLNLWRFGILCRRLEL